MTPFQKTILLLVQQAEADSDPIIMLAIAKDGINIKTNLPPDMIAVSLATIAAELMGREGEMISKRLDPGGLH